ncbi:MAG TPA: acetyl-CoA carboxylase biotin carboxyl carrier protein subunit [Anaerolineales bacterium]|nr:acetyl-CoA carboxylase biotin carboxyl carrier protein subunit [Anaerolineae bacterium]HIP87745.1 acetyl-CoA carboxylase biotin carboxyl carrier protein subunit [Anaerolineales bacterium]
MKAYRITLDNRTFHVKVLDDPRQDEVRVEVDGEVFTVGVEPVVEEVVPVVTEAVPAPSAPSAPTPAPEAAPEKTVTAPLPGIIKSIVVRPGQQVKFNDELLVIEAMKMDNVIRAPRDGTIGTILVAEGRQVAYGEPLLEFAD